MPGIWCPLQSAVLLWKQLSVVVCEFAKTWLSVGYFVFWNDSNLQLDEQCEAVQYEITTLEMSYDEVRQASMSCKSTITAFKKQLTRLENEVARVSSDVNELSQAIQDDVIIILSFQLFL